MSNSKEQAVLELVRSMGTIRIKDLLGKRIHPEFARRLVQKGLLSRSARGLYSLPDAEITEHHDLAILAKRVPKGVICLTSALRFHNIGTQLPRKIWVAIPRGSATPRLSHPPASFIRFSGSAYSDGIEEHKIEGVSIRVYSPAKTLADCFRFRNRIGLEAVLEAVRECLRDRKATSDDIHRYATICRVWNIMRPYLEAMP